MYKPSNVIKVRVKALRTIRNFDIEETGYKIQAGCFKNSDKFMTHYSRRYLDLRDYLTQDS